MDFSKLPFNTQRAFVSQEDKSGTKIIIPVHCRDDAVMEKAKQELFEFLDKQTIPMRRM